MIHFLKFILAIILSVCMLTLTACTVLFPTPNPTPTITPTFTVTPTINWFPPTNTSTTLPTYAITPTEELQLNLGDIILREDFSDPELWITALSSLSSAVIERNRLILDISSQTPLTITSLRTKPSLSDFYAEITVNLNLCQGHDQYGLLFRAWGQGNYYRYAIDCQGQVRLSRVRNGKVIPLQDWMFSGDAPYGAPGELCLGVWAFGQEMRFFIDDYFQFSSRDPVFQGGTLGVFASSAASTPVNVSFSDLTAYSILTSTSTPIHTSTRTPFQTTTPNPR